jgi:steroid delta-isomerase-like uncharacterized protein
VSRPGGTGRAAENARLGRRLYEEMWNSRDFDGMVRLASEDIESVQVPFNIVMRGPDGYRAFLEGWATAFPDARLEVRRVTSNDDGVVVEFISRGTHTGSFVGPAGTIPATGRVGELAVCHVLEIDDGVIRKVRSYFDSGALLRLARWSGSP